MAPVILGVLDILVGATLVSLIPYQYDRGSFVWVFFNSTIGPLVIAVGAMAVFGVLR